MTARIAVSATAGPVGLAARTSFEAALADSVAPVRARAGAAANTGTRLVRRA